MTMVKIAQGIKVKLSLPSGPFTGKDLEALPETERTALISQLNKGFPIKGYTPSPRFEKALANVSPVVRAFKLYNTRRAMTNHYRKHGYI